MKTHTEKILEEIETIRRKFKGKYSKFNNQEQKSRIKDLKLPILQAQLKEAERHDRIMQKIKAWIKEHEFVQHQGGYLIQSDDLEVEINKIDQEEE